jgi:hypothetical protein
MKKKLFFIFLSLLVFSVRGQLIISSNTTWSTDQVLTQSVIVQQGVTLTINPGVQVQVLFIDNNSDLIGDVKIEVKGSINVLGAACNKVTFAPYVVTTNKKYWSGIEIDTLSNSCDIKNAIIKNANIGIKLENSGANIIGVEILNSQLNGINAIGVNANLSLTNSIIKESDGEGLLVSNASQFTLDNSIIKLNGSSGLHLNTVQNSTISNSVFYNNGKSGIYSLGSTVNLNNSISRKNARMGICLNNSVLTGNYLDIDSNSVDGIFIGGSSNVNLQNSSIISNTGFGIESTEYIVYTDFGNIAFTNTSPTVTINNSNFIKNRQTSVVLTTNDIPGMNATPYGIGYSSSSSGTYCQTLGTNCSSWSEICNNNQLNPLPYSAWYNYQTFHLPFGRFENFVGAVACNPNGGVNPTSFKCAYGIAEGTNIQNPYWQWDPNPTSTYNPFSSCYPMSGGGLTNSDKISFVSKYSGSDNPVTFSSISNSDSWSKFYIEYFSFRFGGYEYRSLINSNSVTDLLTGNFWDTIMPTAVTNSVGAILNLNGFVINEIVTSHSSLPNSFIYSNASTFQLQQSSVTFCSGGNNYLIAPAGNYNYQWYDNDSPISNNNDSLMINNSGSYSISLSGICSATSSPIALTVISAPGVPNISVGGSTTFCQGGSVTLTSSSTSGNTWSNGETTQAIIVTQSGNYTVSVSNGSCSATSSPLSVTVNAAPTAPTISVGGSTTFCSGGSVVLTSSSATGNTWSNGVTSQAITVSQSGSYTLSIFNGTCSATSSPVTVTVNNTPSTPTISASGPTTFCSGGLVTLTSSSATGNTWSNGATTQAITVSQSGSYTVTVANGNCSATSSPIVVTVNAAPSTPTISAGGSTTFCSGGSVTLISSSASGNTWSNGETTQSITVTQSGNYTVSNTNGSCTATSNPLSVSVNTFPATPTISASGSTTFCQGGSVTLTSSSASGNTWSNGATTQAVTISQSGNYTVTVANGNCSATSSPIAVTVNAAPSTPTIFASGPTTFCSGESVTLTSSSASGNTWSNGATTQAITVSQSGNYTVSLSNGTCTATSSALTVTVNTVPATPTISAGGSTTFCSGGSVTLTSSSALGNTWSNGATTQAITVSQSGNYTVTVANGNCSATSSPIAVSVNAAPSTPTISASGPTTFCSGGSVTLTSSSANGNTWSNGATTQSITVSNNGNYSVTITGLNGCSVASTALSVNVNQSPPIPVITASGPTTFCQGGSVTLTSPGTVGLVWHVGSNQYPVDTLIVANNYNNIYITSTLNGCNSQSALLNVTMNQLPNAIINSSGPTTFCSGSSVSLTSNQSSSYLWSNGATTQVINPTTSGSYSVTVTDINGCTKTSSPTIVTVKPMPSTAVSINGSQLIANQSSAVYQWLDCLNNNISIFGANASSYSPNQSGTYAVSVSLNGCSDTSSCYAVNVTSSLMEEEEKALLSIHPNPTMDYFILTVPNEFIGRSFTLLDARGRLIIEGVLNGSEETLEVSKLETGTYHLKIDQVSERYKLIKQ